MRSEQHSEGVNEELTRRHRAALMTVVACCALTVLLTVLVLAEVRFALPSDIFDASLAGALWIGILLFGLGAVAFRRTKFSEMRLRDIAALRGASGLLATLQSTTVIVALIGGAVAVMGFVISLITRDRMAMLRAAPIALAVLFYSYPRRGAWQRMLDVTQSSGDEESPSAKGSVT